MSSSSSIPPSSSSSSSSPTPSEVLNYKSPTSDFLCSLNANNYGIDFLAFKVRDYDTQTVVFEVAKDPNAPPPVFPDNFDYNQLRSIQYKFPSAFLRYRTVGTTLKFKVGGQEVKKFRMIERHYAKSGLIKSYDFTFDFCIPNSINEWEAIYEMPILSESIISEIMESGTSSDSFYFVGDELIMHNKAKYTFVDDLAQSSASTGAPK